MADLFVSVSQQSRDDANRLSLSVSAAMLARWAGWPTKRVAPAAAAFRAFGSTVRPALVLHQSGRSVSGTPLGRRLVDTRKQAVEALDPVVGAGLERRVGHYIEPTFGGFANGQPVESDEQWLAAQALVACTDRFHDDQHLWSWIESLLSVLGRKDGTVKLRVCKGCSIVFAPRRKTGAAVLYCGMCNRPPAPLLTAAVLAELRKPGSTATVRVPSPVGGQIRRWGRRTIGLCVACEQPFVARKGNARTHPGCRV